MVDPYITINWKRLEYKWCWSTLLTHFKFQQILFGIVESLFCQADAEHDPDDICSVLKTTDTDFSKIGCLGRPRCPPQIGDLNLIRQYTDERPPAGNMLTDQISPKSFPPEN